MKKKFLTVLVTGTILTLGSLAPTASATDYDAQINAANQRIAGLADQKSVLEVQIQELSTDIANVQSQIAQVQAEQEAIAKEIQDLQAQSKELEKIIAQRQDQLEEQARAVQVNGTRSYVDFLLNADSFTDAVNRIGVVVDLVGANRQLIAEQARDKQAVEDLAQQEQVKYEEKAKNVYELENLSTQMNDTFSRHSVTLASLSDAQLEEIAARDTLVADKEAYLKQLEEARAKAEAERIAQEKAAEAARQAMLAAQASAAEEAAKATASTSTTTGVVSLRSAAAAVTAANAENPTTEAATTQAAAQTPVEATTVAPQTEAPTTAAPTTQAPTTQAAAVIVPGGGFAAPDPSFVAALNGGYFGQCTYYVYNRFAQLGAPIGTAALGNAADWARNAAAAGYAVSSTPRAGTAMVFPGGVGGASAVYGHVAFVEQVYADGSLLISEMNVVGVNVISTRTISASVAAQCQYISFGL